MQAALLDACRIIPSLAPGAVSQERFSIGQAPSDGSPNLRAYLGVWEGYLGGSDPAARYDPSAIVIRSVSASEADVSLISGGTELRATGPYEVLPSGHLRGGYGADGSVTFTLSLDAQGRLHGELVRAGQPAVTLTDMVRCDLSLAKAPAAGICRVVPSLAPGVLSPERLAVDSPATGLPTNLASYLGVWEGYWDGTNPSVLVIKSVSSSQAQVVYVFEGAVVAGVSVLEVTTDAKLQRISTGGGISLAWSLMGERLSGELVEGRARTSITMSRCSVS
jgi:hypothetical protein